MHPDTEEQNGVLGSKFVLARTMRGCWGDTVAWILLFLEELEKRNHDHGCLVVWDCSIQSDACHLHSVAQRSAGVMQWHRGEGPERREGPQKGWEWEGRLPVWQPHQQHLKDLQVAPPCVMSENRRVREG